MNWTLDGYKTYIGLFAIGIGAVMTALGIEGGQAVNNAGMMLAGLGAADKIRKQAKR